MIHFTKWLAPVGFKVRKRSDQKLVVIPEYKMIALQIALEHKQGIKQNERTLVHVWGQAKRAFFLRTQSKIIKLISIQEPGLSKKYVTRPEGEGVVQKDDKVRGGGSKVKSDVTTSKIYC